MLKMIATFKNSIPLKKLPSLLKAIKKFGGKAVFVNTVNTVSNTTLDKECEGNCCKPLPEILAIYVKCYHSTKKLRLCQQCANALNNIK